MIRLSIVGDRNIRRSRACSHNRREPECSFAVHMSFALAEVVAVWTQSE